MQLDIEAMEEKWWVISWGDGDEQPGREAGEDGNDLVVVVVIISGVDAEPPKSPPPDPYESCSFLSIHQLAQSHEARVCWISRHMWEG
jgi:hypothetical protein